MKITKIFIADDHPVFLFGLKSIIGLMNNCEIEEVASNGISALSIIEKSNPEIAILDIDMPGLSGLEVTKRIAKMQLSTKVIILTMHKDESIFNLAFDSGAIGYVLKDNTATDIVNCINSVIAGEIFVSPQIVKFFENRQEENYITELNLLNELTETEKKVLIEVSLNKSSLEIASLLHVSNKTIQNHRFNICKKMKLKGINSLLSYALLSKKCINLIFTE